MQGSLAIARGTLFVGLQAKSAHVRTFDLGGRELATAFSFRDERAGCSAASGLAVDGDHRILVADTPADRVRRFTLFGREVDGIGAPQEGAPGPIPVLPGLVTRPVDVEVRGNADQGWVAVACGGEARHAVQLFEPDLTYRTSCRSLGEAGRSFQGVVRLGSHEDSLLVAESVARRIQIFREGEFLFAFHLTDRLGERYEPSAVAAVGDGRLVVGCRAPRSALFLVDATGRPLRELASQGEEEGGIVEPTDVVLEPGNDDRHAQLFVIDRDGLRVQVFTLEGRCLGSFSLTGSYRSEPKRVRRNKGGR